MFLQLPTQKHERSDSQHHEDDNQSYDIQGDVWFEHIKFLQRRCWWFKVTISLETLKLLTFKAVSGQSGRFESISNVRQVSDPSKVDWNSVEGNKESGEEKEWNWHDWCEEDAVLNIHSGANHKTHALSLKKDHRKFSFQIYQHTLWFKILPQRKSANKPPRTCHNGKVPSVVMWNNKQSTRKWSRKWPESGHKIVIIAKISQEIKIIYLERNVRYRNCQVVTSKRVPSVKVFLQKHRHFKWDWNESKYLNRQLNH